LYDELRLLGRASKKHITTERQRSQRGPEPQPKPLFNHEGHEDDEAKKKD
jgi:hypothetical protein